MPILRLQGDFNARAGLLKKWKTRLTTLNLPALQMTVLHVGLMNGGYGIPAGVKKSGSVVAVIPIPKRRRNERG